MNISMIKAAGELVGDPVNTFLFVTLGIIVFLVTRWIFDRFNAGWSKRLICEIDLLDRMINSDFQKDKKGEKAIKTIKEHISEITIKKTTLRDRTRAVFDAFQFSIIGTSSMLIVFAISYSSNGTSNGFAYVLTGFLIVLFCLGVDLLRVLWKAFLLPRFLFLKDAMRIKRLIHKIEKQQKEVFAEWEITKDNTQMIQVLAKCQDASYLPSKYYLIVKKQLEHIRILRDCVFSRSMEIIKDCESLTAQKSDICKGYIARWILDNVGNQLKEVKQPYVHIIEEIVQMEKILKSILRKDPGGSYALPGPR